MHVVLNQTKAKKFQNSDFIKSMEVGAAWHVGEPKVQIWLWTGECVIELYSLDIYPVTDFDQGDWEPIRQENIIAPEDITISVNL